MTVHITLHNQTRRVVHLPHYAPWVIKRADHDNEGRLVARGIPRSDRTGPRQVAPGHVATWSWDQTLINGNSLVDPGNYEVEIQTTNNDVLTQGFIISNHGPWAKTICRNGKVFSYALGIGISANIAYGAATGVAPVPVGMLVTEGGLVALGFVLEEFAEDPQERDYQELVTVRKINLTLPAPKSTLDELANEFAISVSNVVAFIEALRGSIESYELARAAGSDGDAAQEKHRNSIIEYASSLSQIILKTRSSLESVIEEIRSRDFPASVSVGTVKAFQSELLQGQIPRTDEFMEGNLIRDLLGSSAKMVAATQGLGSIEVERDVKVFVEWEALQTSLGDLSYAMKNLPADFD